MSRLVQDLLSLELPLTDAAAVLACLVGTCAFFFWLEARTGWRLFEFLPPLVFIYLVPLLMANLPLRAGNTLLPSTSPVYDQIKSIVLPMMLLLLLLKVDVVSAVRVMGKGVLVMLAGTAGVVLGAPIACFLVQGFLEPDAWKSFGCLAGSWIGGTGNLAAVAQMVDATGTQSGLAVLADSIVYVVWLPVLLGSKQLAPWFAKFTGAGSDRVKRMEKAAEEIQSDDGSPSFRDVLYLLCLALAVTWLSNHCADRLPAVTTAHLGLAGDPESSSTIVSAGTWKILIVTTMGLFLSFTPAKHVSGSQGLAMALVYIFVAHMGASSQLSGVLKQAPAFLVGAFLWIFIHGVFCLMAAKLFRVDVHTAAIASAANIGGAASAPLVAAYHNKSLVPASILMALIGYAIGNYAAYIAALLCRWVS